MVESRDAGASTFCDPSVESCSFPKAPGPGCFLTEDLTWDCPDASPGSGCTLNERQEWECPGDAGRPRTDAGWPGWGCYLNDDLEWQCPDDAGRPRADGGRPGRGCVLNDDLQWDCPDAGGSRWDSGRPGRGCTLNDDLEWECPDAGGTGWDAGRPGPDASTPGDGGWTCPNTPESRGLGCACDECVPGTVRWCDEIAYCHWGRQECTPSGQWGVCYEVPERPGNCSDALPYDAMCCYEAGECCQDPRNDGSWGNCGGICQAM